MSSAANDSILTNFTIDRTLMTVLKDCVDHYGPGEPSAEWGNNILSSKLVIYSDGMISKSDVVPPPSHRVSAQELRLCKSISAELASRCTQEVGMGTEGNTVFSAFYMVAQLTESGKPVVPRKITEEMIREKFANTIFPLATIKVEPLQADGNWWDAVCADGEGEENYFDPWHDMIHAFQEHPQLSSPVFVQIGDSRHLSRIHERDYPPGTEMTGSCLPRMALALTASGSIVGLFGDVTHT